jgi:hypothetical protein
VAVEEGNPGVGGRSRLAGSGRGYHHTMFLHRNTAFAVISWHVSVIRTG